MFKIFFYSFYLQMNSGRLEEIELPNFQYYLDVENRIIASADKNSGNIIILCN